MEQQQLQPQGSPTTDPLAGRLTLRPKEVARALGISVRTLYRRPWYRRARVRGKGEQAVLVPVEAVRLQLHLQRAG